MAVVTTKQPVTSRDSQLLARYGRGDRSALEELFVQYRDVAYRVAYRLLGHEADALDAVQEAFAKALLRLDGFEGRSSFKTWLLRVVTNASLDLGRQRGRRETQSLAALSHADNNDLERATIEDPAVRLYRGELRQALQQALSQLSEAQRRTFVLHAEAELSYREVAKVLGISIGTVMSRLYYSRQKLRGFLEMWADR